MTGLDLTGERTLPGIEAENYWFRRHEAAYLGLAELIGPPIDRRHSVLAHSVTAHSVAAHSVVPHSVVPQPIGSRPIEPDRSAAHPRLLEIGSGEGYGAALLAERAGFSCALDYDAAAISHLATRYPGLNPVRANLAALPVGTDEVDVVVSLQVIEHVWDHRQFLDECARVLRPGGQLLLSTPNRLTFSPGASADQRPVNPFHTHEFTADELARLVSSAGFSELRMTGLHARNRLIEMDERYQNGFVAAQLAGPPAGWSAGLRTDVASVTAADFVIDADRLDASLDLIALARWA